MSKDINELAIQDKHLIKAGRKSSEIISNTREVDTDSVMRDNFDFSDMHLIPNLLVEEHSIR